MDDQETREFDLEEILSEFGSAASEESAVEEISAQMPEETAPEDTLAAPEKSVTDETIRLDSFAFTKGQVRNAYPIVEEELPAQEPEAFTGNWEPDYEQPISEYVPPQPIVFRPRSRLHELKRKLVAGPEKEYYALAENGLGKLQVLIFLSFLVVVISAVATAMYALGMVQENRLRLMVFGQFMAMLVSALLGSNQLIEGVTDLFHKRFTLNTLLVCTFMICCLDGIVCLQQLRVPCCAAFSLEMAMSLWNAYQRRNVKLGQLDTMRKATRLDSISAVPDYCNEKTGFLRGEGQVEDFMDTYEAPAKPDKILSGYAFAALLASLAVGITGGILHSFSLGLQVTAVSLLAAVPATAFITTSRPMAVLERRLHGLGTVLCGWQGVEGLSQKAVFPIGYEDIFPLGTVKMSGVKFYSQRKPDETVAYATALITADGGSLAPLFTQLLDSRSGMHYFPEELQPYEGGGLGGVVNGESVLVGSLSFLRQMEVEIPEGVRVNQAVCVAINEELCGLFAITYEKDQDASAGMTTLCAYRKLNPVVITDDFMLTPGFLQDRFRVKSKKILFPPHSERGELRKAKPEEDAPALLLTTAQGLSPLAYGVTGARVLKTACNLGVVIHMIGGIVGILMMLALAILGARELLTPANLFLYELVWMIPGLLITEWTRTI